MILPYIPGLLIDNIYYENINWIANIFWSSNTDIKNEQKQQDQVLIENAMCYWTGFSKYAFLFMYNKEENNFIWGLEEP